MACEAKLGGSLVKVSSRAMSAGLTPFKDEGSDRRLSLLLDPLIKRGIRIGMVRHSVSKRQKT